MKQRHPLIFAIWLSLLLLPTAGLASEAFDFSSYDEARTIEVLTNDEDGDPRETTIWVVVVEGAAYINTNTTTWGENVERTPRLAVRFADATRTFDVLFLEDADARHKILEAFREKYGFQDKLLSFFMDESKAVVMQLVASPGE